MGEVTVEYGAIYWTHNQTLYPTTTTTTTVSIFQLFSVLNKYMNQNIKINFNTNYRQQQLLQQHHQVQQ